MEIGHYNNDNITDFLVKYNCGGKKKIRNTEIFSLIAIYLFPR